MSMLTQDDAAYETDVFHWLMNETSTSNFFEEQQYGDGSNFALQPGTSNNSGGIPPTSNQGAPQPVHTSHHQQQHHYQADHSSGFGWADGLLGDSPYFPEPVSYPDVPSLTDDFGGAFDVVMGGPQTGHPGVTPAMHAFAIEAATGQRRRPTQIYYEHSRPTQSHDYKGYGGMYGGHGSQGMSQASSSVQYDSGYVEESHHGQEMGVPVIDESGLLNPMEHHRAPHQPQHQPRHQPQRPAPQLQPQRQQPRQSPSHQQSHMEYYDHPIPQPQRLYEDTTTDISKVSQSHVSTSYKPQPQQRSPPSLPPLELNVSDPNDGDSKQDDAKEPKSPRRLAQRERNREAVRNCRKRKREYAQKLKERETMLEEENARIRLQLKLGSEEMQSNMMLQCHMLAKQMKETLVGKATASTPSMHVLNEKYVQTHADQGRNREEATKHIISRLIRQVEPTHVTKMYLWQTAQEDSYFRTSGGLWDELKARLDLSKEQLKELRDRRPKVLDMCKEIAAVLNKLDNLHAMILKRKRLSGESLLFRNISKVLSDDQLAKFITFVHEFQFGSQEEGWNNYLLDFDKELEQEMLDRSGDWVVHNPTTSNALKNGDESTFNQQKTVFNAETNPSENEIDDDLMRNRHKSAIVLKELFERSEEELMGFAKAAFSPNIDLYDPNTVRVIHGIEKVLKYIRRIRISFEGLTATEENFMTRKNVARGRWTLTGTYYGYGMKMPPRPTSEGPVEGDSEILKKPEGKKVSFKVVIAYRFIPGSAQIQQLLVSWAALDVMRQLSLLPESFKETMGDKMKQENELAGNAIKKFKLSSAGSEARRLERDAADLGSFPRLESGFGSGNRKHHVSSNSLMDAADMTPQPSKPLPKLTQKMKETKCVELTKIFQVDTPEERLEIADDLLDDNCIFQDANMGGAFRGPDGCVDYVRRLRRPFSTMEMTRHNFVSVNKRKRGNKAKKEKDAPKPAKTANPTAETLELESRTQMGCLVKGLYSGALVDKPRPYEFNTTIFVTFNPENNKILEVEMVWNASGLMKQLGVLQ